MAGDELPESGEADESVPAGQPRPGQKPLETDPTKYAETGGYVSMVPAPDGGVMPAPGEPPEPGRGLTDDNLVCTAAEGRPVCKHYAALLMPAEGVHKGAKRKPLRIRRFCTALAAQSELMELTDSEVYGCTLRDPRDESSQGMIERFEREQREKTAEHEQTSGRMDL